MAMHSTILTRRLRTTPLSLFRQQIPRQQPQQQLSCYWSPKTIRSYSTNPKENDGSEKPAANEAATDSNNTRSETTTTTTSSSAATNTGNSRAHDVLLENEKNRERVKKLFKNLGLERSQKDLRISMRSLGKGIEKIKAEQPEEKGFQRQWNPTIPKQPENDAQAPEPQTPPELNTVANRISPVNASDRKPKPTIKTVPLKLGPQLGRQITVQGDKGFDCASAIRTLESSCRSNGLRRQEAFQRFHVRRGQLRKNLRIQRWRKLFKFSFLETVKKIDRMRAQGW